MKSQLFLIYLHYRNSILLGLTILALIPFGLNQWFNYKAKTTNYTPWTVTDVLSLLQFTVIRGDESRTIELCGLAASSDEARDYLRSIIDKGNGTVELESVGNFYEAWVLLKPELEQQIHLNTQMVETRMATLANHTHCLSAENLEMAFQL